MSPQWDKTRRDTKLAFAGSHKLQSDTRVSNKADPLVALLLDKAESKTLMPLATISEQ